MDVQNATLLSQQHLWKWQMGKDGVSQPRANKVVCNSDSFQTKVVLLLQTEKKKKVTLIGTMT